MVTHPQFGFGNRIVLRVARRRDLGFTKKPLEKSRTFRFRQVHVHEHDPRRVQHEAAVGIAGDDSRGFAGMVFDFTQHRFTERAVGIITVTVLRNVTMLEAVGELLRRLRGKGLGLGQAVVRPAPTQKISAGALGPKRWKVHGATLK